MSAKHFINDPTHAVLTALRSLTFTNPSLVFDEPNKIVYRHPSALSSTATNVSLVCGGGSGHEPGFPGYVGRGLLTACVAGTIFASPGADQIRTCLQHRLPPHSKGTLVVVMNYTGDILNFGMGVERARAMGKKVEMVVVQDDVGVGRTKGGKVGRRGISGSVLVVKMCGALAEMGAELEDCVRVGKLAIENVVSVGASLSRVHVPGRAVEEAKEEEERLALGWVEIGMGIHNEPGCEKVQEDLPGLVKKMLAQMLDPNDKDRAYVNIQKSDDTVLLINNFGGVSNLELGAITTEVVTQLREDYGLKPVRTIAGTLNGSLNGLGFSVSILKLRDTGLGAGKSMLELLDAPAEAIGWPRSMSTETWEKKYDEINQKIETKETEPQSSSLRANPPQFKQALQSGLSRVIAAEPDITKYDTITGDGDCGTGLKRGAEALLALLSHTEITDDVVITLSQIVRVVESSMDGTSGALYAIFLNALAHNLRSQEPWGPTQITPSIWANALRLSLESLGKYTPARKGDRTLVDALAPFVETLGKTGDVKEAAAAAKRGAQNTRDMKASLGRSVYVGGESWQGVPDPGAHGLSEFLMGLAEGL
ncbi:dihydroxyacetone kinase [Lasallia pustulata]|uniref:Dihydroxyacetone kinase n=1 Tax=Lasallia pustulata TaxID=136370 RepID=A0A1W5D819_9LECA|nr:dihydroxyacetone kinase [Lasallia pustulata]